MILLMSREAVEPMICWLREGLWRALCCGVMAPLCCRLCAGM